TVRHRSPMRLRQRCACTRLAAAALKRVTFAGSSLGNAFSPVLTASLVRCRWAQSSPSQKPPVDRHDPRHFAAPDDLLRSDPFAFTKDSAPGQASITTATSLAVHSDERGEGCAIIILPDYLAPGSSVTRVILVMRICG